MKKILITGASGLIGRELTKLLLNEGKEVVHLGRSKRNKSTVKQYVWDINKGTVEEGAFDNVDGIVHLAGAGIADKRWSKKRKQEIIESRTKSADLIYNSILNRSNQPEVFISASAIGYYGAVTVDKIFSEEDEHGNDFQAEVCKLWEKSADNFNELELRTVKLRFGVVLSEKGGALKKMLPPTKLGIGSALGSGNQIFPWVHVEDVVNIISKSLNDKNMIGVFNVVAPSFNNYNDFAKTLAKVLHKPYFLPNVPAIALKLALGEMSEIVLKGSRISSNKIIEYGYSFNHTNLERALKDILK